MTVFVDTRHHSREQEKLLVSGLGFIGGGPISTLRAYQHWHPYAAIYTVTYRGRTVWMTSKQHAIWYEVKKYWHRGKRDTLARIAKIVGCSRATVSRFLRRLDLWRFIDLATLRGKYGGTYVYTRKDPYNETPRRWTLKARQALNNLRAAYIRRGLDPMLQRYRQGRLPKTPYYEMARQVDLTGSTGATLEPTKKISGGAIYGKYQSRKANR